MPRARRRLAEWSLIVLVLLLLVGLLGRQFRIVQGQGELAAIKTTLGALRTAFVIDYLKHAAIDGRMDGPSERNPFLLLDHPPAVYAGPLAALKGQPLTPGTWVFDSFCNCIGYEPLNPQSLDGSGESATLWFRISMPPGPLQIAPSQPYMWQGEPVN